MREFVLNYRHPGPGRVWKGGSEPRLRDRIRGIRGCVPKWGFVRSGLKKLAWEIPLMTSGGRGRPWEALGELWDAQESPQGSAVSQRLPEINMLKMGAIPGKDYHTGPTAPILSMLISCMSQRLRYGLTAPRDYAYISPKTPIVHLKKSKIRF